MTDKLQEIKKRLADATPGRWEYWGGTRTYAINASYKKRVVGCDTDTYKGGIQSWQDAKFIANAPADIAWLISELEKSPPQASEESSPRISYECRGGGASQNITVKGRTAWDWLTESPDASNFLQAFLILNTIFAVFLLRYLHVL